MKNLAKIFMAVAVALFAFACTTDTTENLGPNIEVGKGGGNSLITLSLEHSRTQLGEKAGDLYPVYWSEGDAIAVNGLVSTPLAPESAGAVDATFSFGEQEIVYPYCVVYPAPQTMPIEDEPTEETTEPEPTLPENTYCVTFAHVQPYTVGTFAPQSAPMYAYAEAPATEEEATPASESTTPIQMQHLAGVLRLAVKGDVTLASMTVAAKGKIAGTFLIDCKTGQLTAHEEAVNSVTVLLPEGGLKLNADEATPIYVAVPQGEHGVYTITLVSDALEDNTMVVRFNSDFHPVVAGVVKEFGEVTFTPNANSGEEGELVITNTAQMKRLAQLSEVEQLGNVTKVTIGATIDMADVAWTPINLFPSHIVFDGGADQGYSIKGLKAPLFNSTAATIQNLKLTDVAIVETEEPWVGTIARGFYGTMTNCEAVGSLEVNNTTFVSTASMGSYDVLNVGGLVGQAGRATFENCTNRVNINILSLVGEGETRGVYCAAGGVIGAAHSECSLNNVDNHGEVKLDAKHKTYYNAAGIVGHLNMVDSTIGVKKITFCDNHGDVYTTGNVDNATLTLGGITANMLSGMEFTDNTNEGAIHNDGVAGSIYLAGMVAYISESPILRCTNKGPITNSGASTSGLHMGGIVGHDAKAAITDCTNDTTATLTNTGDIAGNVYIGGITGCDNGLREGYNLDPEEDAISGCYNKGAISHSAVAKAVFLAGIHARMAGVNIVDCHNTGAITHTGSPYEDLNNNTYVAGICGHECVGLTGCTNNAPISVGGEDTIHSSGFFISGIAYKPRGSVSGCKNLENGDITVNNILGSSSINVFGVCISSFEGDGVTISDCENKGDISVGETASVTSGSSQVTYIGGCWGTANNPISDCKNYGNITVNKLVPKHETHISGTIYNAVKGVSGCTNSGAITVGDATAEAAQAFKSLAVAGVVNKSSLALSNCDNLTGANILIDNVTCTTCYASGICNTATVGGTECDNSGNITIGAKVVPTSNFVVGGVVSYLSTSSATTDGSLGVCTNNGTIKIGSESATSTYKDVIVGGIAGYAYRRVYSCENKASGDISLSKASVGQMFIGGIAGCSYLSTKDSAENKWSLNVNRGDVTLAGVSNDASAQYIAGISGNNKEITGATSDNLTEWYQCTNYGNISLTDQTSAISSGNKSGRLCISGMFGYLTAAFNVSDCENSGYVKVIDAKNGTNAFVGGVIGQFNISNDINPNAEIKNCTNRGEIYGSAVKLTGGKEATSSSEGFFLGGIIAGVWHAKKGVDYEHYYTGLKNYGAITLEGSYFVSDKRECLGGIMGDIVGFGKFYNCYNEGPITFSPTVTGSTTTSVNANVRMGGIIGSTSATTPTNSAIPSFTFEYCTNSGAITANQCTMENYLLISGVGGYMSSHGVTTYSISNCGNSGKVSINKVTAKEKNMYAGGVFAYIADPHTTISAENSRLVNTGDIEINNCSLTDANTWVGGVTARTVVAVPNAESYCKITAEGFTQKVGMIMGTARTDTIKATNGKVGGELFLTKEDSGFQNPDTGEIIYTDAPGALNEENWFQYVYANGTTLTEAVVGEGGDGCSRLETKPSVPTYTPANK